MSAQVFISYAHADDQVFDEDAKGWVTNIVDKLQKAVAMKPGGSQVHCWMDHRLEPQRSVDDTLRQRIQGSQCILAFMSPRYLESEWCRKEMETFVQLVGGGNANDRVFLVELLPTDRGNWHQGIRSITAIKFWDDGIDQPEPMTLGWPLPNPKADRAYWRELNSLASVMARQIQGLPPTPPDTPTEATPPAPLPSSDHSAAKTIWIADPTDDVLENWEALAEALKAYRVLPKAPGNYPSQNEAQYRQAMAGELAQADLLVQLLGGSPGKKPSWADSRFVRILADAAKAEAQRRNLPLLAWRGPDIVLNKIKDLAHKTLLDAASDSPFEDFCQQVLEHLARPAQPPAPLSVVINADKPDRGLGEQARDILDGLGVDATLAAEPLPTQAPAESRQLLETLLLENNGVLIVYGSAPLLWVQTQHAIARKVLALHRKGIWGGLLDGPPPDKPDPGLSPRNLMLLPCRDGLKPALLKQFIETLKQGVGHV